MKNTHRIHGKTNPKSKIPQGNKPSIPGQNTASIGLAKTDTKSKTTLGALRIGEALGLDESEIKAFALLSEWEGQTVAEYCRSTVAGYLQASCDDLISFSRSDDRSQEKEWALKFLPRLKEVAPEFCRRAGIESPQPSAIPQTTVSPEMGRIDDIVELETAVRQSAALDRLMLNNLDHENAGAFHINNGRLAAGLESLIEVTQKRLSSAFNAVR
jgi:hypothetical protein